MLIMDEVAPRKARSYRGLMGFGFAFLVLLLLIPKFGWMDAGLRPVAGGVIVAAMAVILLVSFVRGYQGKS